ncbi:Na+/H+ antiporter NhaA [Marinitenerispora sediminis]|uniref:Na(+)/H(+) antiporter NhaA n=1 Tax=Marinitenerispora sediminis TaxID=1931232 RepID=A0A368T7U8_9ACTN|nr:Na+/H+ antiporter NhaA [Marinitenerispora sediminis]RCV52006.1 Na+/H+ antiporter NhaA [Marinitenerispora sediminis]RCV56917.1 Na+/H+ antiporter NhaA [Marinitenerispora sediminis]RCV60065.1 Na+/H+ antiporter NhaA [Marinitenerispora sediminis]
MTQNRGSVRLTALADVLRSDVVAGFLLIGGALLALLWANSPLGGGYDAIRTFTFGPESLHLNLSVEAWAADGLLAVFFFIVGNELKQEFVHGELRSPRRAVLPIVAALCGMVVPALIYAGVNFSQGDALRGWGIPMATDIAFAVAILAVVGRYLPPALRTFLLTLAIVDDLGAIIVIAVFYTDHLSLLPLAGALLLLGVFGYLQRGRGAAAALNRSPLPNWLVYVPLAFAIWALVHASGVHATIAGVAMGMLMRTVPLGGEPTSPSQRVEHVLRPWSSGVALPVFAVLSAGVVFDGLDSMFTDTAAVGVVLGLVVGKVIGIFGGSWITTRLTRAELNPSLSWIDIAGMSLLAGIGFTVSLLIAELSFPDHPEMLAHAKAGVLIASLLATVLASCVLLVRSAHYRKHGLPGAEAPPAPESALDGN